MTPETLRIDRIFRGVGRIARASGTTDPTMRRKLNRMLDALNDEGRLDILRGLRDGNLDFLPVYELYQRRALHEIALGAFAQPLAATMFAWIDSLIVPRDVSKKHRESLETSRRYFERHEPNAIVNDLPRVLEELRETIGRKYPRSFNLARAAALAFVRAKFKRSSALYLAVSAVEIRKLAKHRKQREGLTPQELRGFFPSPETDWIDAIAWTMATTGMHAEEYWGEWSTLADRVHIQGTKRGGRVRDVPLIRAPVVPTWNRRKFEDDLRERTRTVQVYDLRRTFARTMESAGIPRTRRRMYMGHGKRDTTDDYERHEVAAFLVEDAATLRAYLSLSPTESHTLRIQRIEGA